MNRSAMMNRRGDERGFGLVEALIAVTILVVGLLAVSGLTLASATQVRLAKWQTEQTTAGQLVLEKVEREGFAAAADQTDTVTVDGHDYVVTVTVTNVSATVKDVSAQVAGVGSLSPRVIRTRLYQPRPLPKY